MERVHNDLVQMYGTNSLFCNNSNHNYRLVLSVIDCFSKYCRFVPLCTKASSEVAKALCSIFRELIFRELSIIQSDNETDFAGEVANLVCSGLGIKTIQGQPYHHQSQGQVESLNKRVKQRLANRLITLSA